MKSSNTENIIVSIVCNTYNQEDYIADALESFIMQKTSFKFEILVHDDASTDSTANIVREYEKKYPDLIKPIYEAENQYSQKNGMIAKQQYGRAKGKYIAFCEGDDYWLDDEKLQKQVDFMESHPGYSLCVHTAQTVEADTKKVIDYISVSEEDRDMTVDEMIMKWGCELPTNSMLYLKNLRDEYPEFLLHAPVGDYPLTLYLSLKGKVRFMSDCMSAYRHMAKGSWSTSFLTDNKEAWERRINLLEGFVVMLNQIDRYSRFKYHKKIKQRISGYHNDMVYYAQLCKSKEIIDKVYKFLPLKFKLIYFLECHFPIVIKIYNKVRGFK